MTQKQRIAKRRADMPKPYRGIYDKAMSGQSKTAAIHAFCLECMGWRREEVRRCESYSCPLYLYKPYGFSNQVNGGADFAPESTKDDAEVS